MRKYNSPEDCKDCLCARCVANLDKYPDTVGGYHPCVICKSTNHSAVLEWPEECEDFVSIYEKDEFPDKTWPENHERALWHDGKSPLDIEYYM